MFQVIRAKAAPRLSSSCLSALLSILTTQLPSQSGVWENLGQSKAGTAGAPLLIGSGGETGKQVSLSLSSARPLSLAIFGLGLSRVDAPLLGGTLVPLPVITVDLHTNDVGRATLAFPLAQDPNLAGLAIYAQVVIADPHASFGAAFANAVRGTLFRMEMPVTQPPGWNAPLRDYDVTGLGSACQSCVKDAIDNQVPDDSLNRINAGTGVLPHSGQAYLEVVDLQLPGRDEATNLSIRRRHMSMGAPFPASPFGPSWAFNYSQVLVKPPNDAIVTLTGFGRVSRFAKSGANRWVGAEERFDVLTFDPSSLRFAMRTPQGTVLEFEGRALSSGSVAAHLTRVVSRNNNTLQFAYEAGPEPGMARILSITDSWGLPVRFTYASAAYAPGVSAITDYADNGGREFRYAYDSNGRLLSVRSPLVLATRGLNDFPNGKLTTYSYDEDPANPLALAAVVSPNENAAGTRRPMMSWDYYRTGSFAKRVRRFTLGNQQAGDLAAGGTFEYSYELIGLTKAATGPNDVISRTTVLDRRGTQTLLEHNRIGQIVNESIRTNLNIRPSSPPSYERRFEYTSDGLLIKMTRPMGGTSHFTYPSSSEPRFTHAHVIGWRSVPDSRGAAQAELRRHITYDPVFGVPVRITDVRGFEGGNAPTDYTTRHHLDHHEDLASSIQVFAPLLGVSTAVLSGMFAAAGISDLKADVNGDGTTTRRSGDVIYREYPAARMPAQAARLGMPLLQSANEVRRYNAYGQPTYLRDPEFNVTKYSYWGANTINGDRVRVATGDPSAGGYLREIQSDMESHPQRQSGQNPQPVGRLTTLQYTAQGAFPANLLGIPTAKIDGRRIKHTSLVNELGQVVTSVRAADVTLAHESGLVPYAYQQMQLYDANDNVVETRLEKEAPRNTFIVAQHTFTILNQLRRSVRDVGGARAVEELQYDSNGMVTKRIQAAGTAEQTVEVREWDERDLGYALTRGYGTSQAARVTNTIDVNGNVIADVDATGDIVLSVYDGYDRITTTIDRMGNRTVLTRDSVGHVVRRQLFGSPDGSTSMHALLEDTQWRFDERNRRYRRDRAIFHYAGRSVGVINDGRLDPSDGLVSTIIVLDRLGRPVASVNADAGLAEVRYNGLGWRMLTIDAIGNSEVHGYNANGNPISTIKRETVPDMPNMEQFLWTDVKDALGRTVIQVEPNGQQTRLRWDSRGNLLEAIDPAGTITTATYDGLNHKTSVTTRSSANQVITVTSSYDRMGRVIRRVDGDGNPTTYAYDSLGRMVRESYLGHPLQPSKIWTYTPDGEIATHTDENGTSEVWTTNANGLPTRIQVLRGPGVVGTTEQVFRYDGRDLLTYASDNNEPQDNGDDVATQLYYDSLGRVILDATAVGTAPTLRTEVSFAGEHPSMLKYPNGRLVVRESDANGRVSMIREGATGSSIVQYSYVGSDRGLRIVLGNGVVLDKRSSTGYPSSGPGAGYDANRRHIRHEWRSSSGGLLAGFDNSYNAANLRTGEVRAHFMGLSDTYGFDGLHRIVEFRRNASPTQGGILSNRTLDGANSMTSFNDEGVARNPIVNGMNQYTSFNGRLFNYSLSGSLIDDGVFSYEYDRSNRLVRVRDKISKAEVLRVCYDYRGRRVLKTTSAGSTRYHYHDWEVIEERNGANTLLRQYVGGHRLDEHIQLKAYDQPGAPVYYYLTNSQGTVGCLVNDGQVVVEYATYGLLGKPYLLAADKITLLGRSLVGNTALFQGRYYDFETGLYEYRHRYYSPALGRFITQDLLGGFVSKGGNYYSAFNEDPINGSDPDGLAPRQGQEPSCSGSCVHRAGDPPGRGTKTCYRSGKPVSVPCNMTLTGVPGRRVTYSCGSYGDEPYGTHEGGNRWDRYGNWCGIGYGGEGYPVDDLDRACCRHDKCVERRPNYLLTCSCNQQLVAELLYVAVLTGVPDSGVRVLDAEKYEHVMAFALGASAVTCNPWVEAIGWAVAAAEAAAGVLESLGDAIGDFTGWW